MRNRDQKRLWRFLSFSAAPFLTILAVLLVQREDRVSQLFGALVAGAAVLALIGPLVLRRGNGPRRN